LDLGSVLVFCNSGKAWSRLCQGETNMTPETRGAVQIVFAECEKGLSDELFVEQGALIFRFLNGKNLRTI
jgi:hypothetical protein